MKRKIVNIDETLCNGCGICVPNCQEGALQIIDGKARLISDLFCDGLGACLGHCPQGAITIEEREAEAYDEIKVIETIEPQGYNTIMAHLKHLKEHGETEFVQQAVGYLRDKGYDVQKIVSELHQVDKHVHSHSGCPSSIVKDFRFATESNRTENNVEQRSELRQWPVQMHLVNPLSSFFKESDLVLAADCVPFAMGDFHSKYLRGKSLAIACPKLDGNKEIYLDKLVALIEQAQVNTINVIIMEVPCCGGLLRLAQTALAKANRKVPIKATVIGIQGNIVSENWV